MLDFYWLSTYSVGASAARAYSRVLWVCEAIARHSPERAAQRFISSD